MVYARSACRRAHVHRGLYAAHRFAMTRATAHICLHTTRCRLRAEPEAGIETDGSCHSDRRKEGCRKIYQQGGREPDAVHPGLRVRPARHLVATSVEARLCATLGLLVSAAATREGRTHRCAPVTCTQGNNGSSPTPDDPVSATALTRDTLFGGRRTGSWDDRPPNRAAHCLVSTDRRSQHRQGGGMRGPEPDRRVGRVGRIGGSFGWTSSSGSRRRNMR